MIDIALVIAVMLPALALFWCLGYMRGRHDVRKTWREWR